eukprot:CAMPEP_0174711156 /NCGR_PEP_ID=MMETSP1094-20130205/12566_1 /TAXON_ID=156173 /ORGANISM="Chrysochromulina brevifilum, Strain UTEX LB 985" /LENGTH=152 /DNA_ID=CAMNT_0015910051 /DNA_START=165 /DNA_END=620 /DNA_ORIENTATION=-
MSLSITPSWRVADGTSPHAKAMDPARSTHRRGPGALPPQSRLHTCNDPSSVLTPHCISRLLVTPTAPLSACPCLGLFVAVVLEGGGAPLPVFSRRGRGVDIDLEAVGDGVEEAVVADGGRGVGGELEGEEARVRDGVGGVGIGRVPCVQREA